MVWTEALIKRFPVHDLRSLQMESYWVIATPRPVARWIPNVYFIILKENGTTNTSGDDSVPILHTNLCVASHPLLPLLTHHSWPHCCLVALIVITVEYKQLSVRRTIYSPGECLTLPCCDRNYTTWFSILP